MKTTQNSRDGWRLFVAQGQRWHRLRAVVASLGVVIAVGGMGRAGAVPIDVNPRTVAHIGTQDTTTGYTRLAQGVDANCLNDALYFDVSTPMGKAFFTTLLTAKVTGQKIRIAYEVPSSLSHCFVKLVGLIP